MPKSRQHAHKRCALHCPRAPTFLLPYPTPIPYNDMHNTQLKRHIISPVIPPTALTNVPPSPNPPLPTHSPSLSLPAAALCGFHFESCKLVDTSNALCLSPLLKHTFSYTFLYPSHCPASSIHTIQKLS